MDPDTDNGYTDTYKQGCQITVFLEPNRHQCRQENNENKRQIQIKTKSIVKSLAPKMQ